MAGPLRFYRTNAERQRAYRRRKQAEAVIAARDADDTTCYAYLLHAAVKTAAGASDPLAEKVHRPDPFDTLRALTDHFYDQAGTPAGERPWIES